MPAVVIAASALFGPLLFSSEAEGPSPYDVPMDQREAAFWEREHAENYVISACHVESTDDPRLKLFYLAEEKTAQSHPDWQDTTTKFKELSIYSMEEDGTHGYLGCDGRRGPDGHVDFTQFTSGVWMEPYCTCTLQALDRVGKPVPLSRTSTAEIVRMAKDTDCGVVNAHVFEVMQRCDGQRWPGHHPEPGE